MVRTNGTVRYRYRTYVPYRYEGTYPYVLPLDRLTRHPSNIRTSFLVVRATTTSRRAMLYLRDRLADSNPYQSSLERLLLAACQANLHHMPRATVAILVSCTVTGTVSIISSCPKQHVHLMKSHISSRSEVAQQHMMEYKFLYSLDI